MGFFTNAVHSIGRGVGQAGRVLEKGIHTGFGAARRVVSGVAQAGNTIQRIASKANQLTGGALDIITDEIPGGAAVKGAFTAGLNLTNRADTALSRAEGAFDRGRKRVRQVAGRVQGVAEGAAAAADVAVEQGTRLAKRARTEGRSAARSVRREVQSFRDRAIAR